MHKTLAVWVEEAHRNGEADAALVGTLTVLAECCAELAAVLRRAAIDGHIGAAGTDNAHGEAQKALDILANELFLKRLAANCDLGMLGSEELDDIIDLGRPEASYGVSFDPLDGSSNADVGMTIGSIFSVHRLDQGQRTLLQTGRKQAAAGFAAYGPSTALVLSLGKTAALFQLDPENGTFVLIDDCLQVPRHAPEYAINSSRALHWDAVVAEYVEHRVAGRRGPIGKAFNMRWTGSMVADVLRILKRGGIFLYPLDAETKHLGGRLRLLYEAAPLALILEAAGGRATTGHADLLDVIPTGIHQKVPVILGSADDVEHLLVAYQRVAR